MENEYLGPDRRGNDALLEYRLSQIEKRLEVIDGLVQSVSQDQMRFRLDDHRVDSLAKVTEELERSLTEINLEMPLLLHFRRRVDVVLKGLLSAFVTAMVGAVVYSIQMTA